MRVLTSILQLCAFAFATPQDKLPSEYDVITHTDPAQLEQLLTRWGFKHEKAPSYRGWIVSDGAGSAHLSAIGEQEPGRIVTLRLTSSLEFRKPLPEAAIIELNSNDWGAKCYTRLDGSLVITETLDITDGVRVAKIHSFVKFFCDGLCRPLQEWEVKNGDWWNPLDGPRPFPQAPLPEDKVLTSLSEDDIEILIARGGWQWKGGGVAFTGGWARPITVAGVNMWMRHSSRVIGALGEDSGYLLAFDVQPRDKVAAEALTPTFNAGQEQAAIQKMPDGHLVLIAKIDLRKGVTLGAFIKWVEQFAKDTKELFVKLAKPAPVAR